MTPLIKRLKEEAEQLRQQREREYQERKEAKRQHLRHQSEADKRLYCELKGIPYNPDLIRWLQPPTGSLPDELETN